jgi:hypothetical protein
MRFSILLIASLMVLASATCKQTTSADNAPVADSIQLSRVGGFAGFSDQYMIHPDRVAKDTGGRDMVFDFPEPSKIAAGGELLTNIPPRMWKENNTQYGITVADGIDYMVTAYKGKEKYYWVIRHDPPAHIQAYTQKIHDFFAK